ncbi:carbohydrate-binding module family 20 domain-containing protein [Streptomyces sp. NPDC001816]|uniref:carbohydrate-binding module family 20 domain-containing protein n=1 Tax=Streptomyces sp. NPDC001816 TaxID=3364612 RepID=UPI003696B5BB
MGGSARRGRRPSRYHRRELLAITALLGPTPRDRTAAERFTARPLKSIARSFSVNLGVPFSTSPRSRVVELCPLWSKLVIVPRSTSFAYKYVKKDGSGNVTWESGTNRSYMTGSSSGYTTGDTWK